jgi:hypothetical protein
MQTLPQWPRSIPKVFRPLGTIKLPDLDAGGLIDFLALRRARQLERRLAALQCSGLTGTWSECFFRNKADYTAVNTTASEASLLAGQNQQPTLPALFFDQQPFRSVGFLARGILGTTSTPTIVFQTRLGTTVGSSTLSGTSCGVSAAITTASGVSNKWWEMRLDLTCTVPGQGSTNCTLSGAGYVSSPGGFASPFVYALEPTTPDTATWTLTLDDSVTQYFNLSVTWGTSSASNTITAKQLFGFGYN